MIGLWAVLLASALVTLASAQCKSSYANDVVGALPRFEGSIPSSMCQYAGHIQIDDNNGLFFWYFYNQTIQRENNPITLWLNGGPGSSSLIGLFSEHGPLVIKKVGDDISLEMRKRSWLEVSHML